MSNGWGTGKNGLAYAKLKSLGKPTTIQGRSGKREMTATEMFSALSKLGYKWRGSKWVKSRK